MGLFGSPARVGASAAGAYEIEKSLRTNTNASSYLSRTFDEAGNTKTFTLSSWFKFTKTGNQDFLWMTGGDGNNIFSLVREGVTQLNFECTQSGSGVARFYTTNMLRDFSSWYHFVLAIDTTQGTDTNRMKFYINGVEPTMGGQSVSTSYPAENHDFLWGANSAAHFIGKRSYALNAADWSDMYIADSYYIDGSALTPSSFGETDAATGQWIPKKFEGSYGNAGYYINFDDNSNTTAATLGKDSSGNSNNWTPNNFSVSGAATDSFEDTPTNNFPILNWNQTRSASDDRIHSGALSIDWQDSHDNAASVATFGMHSGKWYFEVLDRTDAPGQGSAIIGIFPDDYANAKRCQNTNAWPGLESGSGVGFNGADQWYLNGSNQGTYGGTWAENDIIGVAVDIDTGKIALSKNGQWADGSGNYDEANINAQKDLNGTGPYYAAFCDTSASHNPRYTINFGQRAFSHTIPTGYKKLCSKNLPTPTIKKPSDYFNTKLYTGTGASHAITGVGFSPNLVWTKGRSDADNNSVFDTVRGATKELVTNGDAAEATDAQLLKSFDADGFTLGTNAGVNGNTETYASWNWKESVSAGFDIVGYTGNGSNRTIAHNLGVKPSLMIVKQRSAAGNHWCVWLDAACSGSQFYYLDSSGAVNSHDPIWNGTEPTSSVFSVGTDNQTNQDTITIIAYLWASIDGHSKFNIYTGNGSTDGPFVYTGFKPAFMIYRVSSGAENWHMVDNKANPYNVVTKGTYANLDNTESNDANRAVDFLSNGFKLRTSHGTANGNGTTYLYIAFAESPFKYANAR